MCKTFTGINMLFHPTGTDVSQDLGTNIPPEYSKHYTVLEKLDELL
jgi:hypothetical protein